MGMVLPLIMFVAFLGLNATSAYYERQLTRTPTEAVAAASAQTFISYKSAVVNFMAANPGFTGPISLQALAPYLPGINLATMSGMSSSVTSTPGVGVTVIVAAEGLAPGAASSAITLSQNDASIGTSVGGQWVSSASPVSTGVSTGMPDGTLTAVIRLD